MKAQGRGEQLSASVVCEQVCSRAEWTSCGCKGGKGSAQLRWHGHEHSSRGLSALLSCECCLWWLPAQLGQAFISRVHFLRHTGCCNVVSRALRDLQDLIGTGSFSSLGKQFSFADVPVTAWMFFFFFLYIVQIVTTYAIWQTGFQIFPLMYHFGKFFGFISVFHSVPHPHLFHLILSCFLLV